jgi:hypothetical protein
MISALEMIVLAQTQGPANLAGPCAFVFFVWRRVGEGK